MSSSEKKLQKRARKKWKINLNTIIKKNISYVVVMIKQTVVVNYSIDD